MKVPASLLLIPFVFASSQVLAQQARPAPTEATKTSAREALQTLETTVGRGAVGHVVGMVGFNGQDQPDTWQILTEVPQDDRILREYLVKSGQLIGPRILQRAEFKGLPRTPVLLTSLKVDSTDVFQLADDQAIAAGVSFDKLNYQLRWRADDPEPTWMATLIDAKNRSVGHVFIMAATGKVVHSEFFTPRVQSSVSSTTKARGKTSLPMTTPVSGIWMRNTAPAKAMPYAEK